MLRFKQFLLESELRVPRVGETVRYAGKEGVIAWVFDQMKGSSEPYYEVGIAFKDDKNFPAMYEYIQSFMSGLNRSKSPWLDFSRKFGTFSVSSNELEYSGQPSQVSQVQSSDDQKTHRNSY